MEDLVERFRLGAAQKEGPRYSRSLRQMALEYMALASAQGVSQGEIAASLGVPKETLRRWQQKEERPQGTALHEVVVVDRGLRGGPVLRMPSGAWVEGLSVSELVTVLESLG